MEWFVRSFIKASLGWLAAGVTLGVVMAIAPAWLAYRPAHLHMNLLGFVTMMIFGVAYHVIPRFSGNPLYSTRLATAHWWLSNAGLMFMVSGFVLRAHGVFGATPMLAVGGVLSAVGAYSFVYGIWRTIDGTAPARAAIVRDRVSQRGTLPLARVGIVAVICASAALAVRWG